MMVHLVKAQCRRVIIAAQCPAHRRRRLLSRLDPTAARIQHVRIPRQQLARRWARSRCWLGVVGRLRGRTRAVRVALEDEVAGAVGGVPVAGLLVVGEEELERAGLVDGRGRDLEVENGAEVARRHPGDVGPFEGPVWLTARDGLHERGGEDVGGEGAVSRALRAFMPRQYSGGREDGVGEGGGECGEE